jgi:signal transduction histidine kinase
MKGTDGLAAVLDFAERARPFVLTIGLLLFAAGVAVTFELPRPSLGLIFLSGPFLAISLNPRFATAYAAIAAIWLVVGGVAAGTSFWAVLPVAMAIPGLVGLVAAVRRSDQVNSEARAALERHQRDLEDALDLSYRQVMYAEALSSAARSYLSTDNDDRRKDALEDILKATDAGMVRLMRNVSRGEQGLHSVIVSLVKAPGGTAEEPGQEFPWARFPNTMAILAGGGAHRFSDLSTIPFPDQQAFREFTPGFRSGVDVPILVEGRWEGTLSLASYSQDRAWEEREVTLLQSVADMIAAAWGREHAVRRLGDAIEQRDRSLRLQAALTDSSRTLLESESEDSLVEALSIVRAAVGADVAFLEISANGPSGPTLSTAHVVRADGESGEFREGEWSAWPYAYGELSEGRPYIIDDIDDLPDRERSWYMVHDSPIRAELNFPVIQKSELVAVVGIAHHQPRRWSASEMRMMGSVARMIGAYSQRDAVRRALEDLIKSKDRFIASVSHELRTPMAVVLGLSTELNSRFEDFSADETSEFIDLIARQSSEVTHIIEDLLVAARASETAVTVIPEPIRIDLAIEEVIAGLPNDYAFKIRAVDVPEMTVMADPVRTRQILRNLIINSHRHGGESVHVIGRSDDNFVHIAIADNGPGIPDDRVEEVFEAYATTGQRSGMTAAIGLGLTVSRQLARLMGGDVIYTKDVMSTFELRLPGVGVTVEQLETSTEAAPTTMQAASSERG